MTAQASPPSLDSLSGVDLSIGIAASFYGAAGVPRDEAIRRVIDFLQAVPRVREEMEREVEDSRLTVSVDDLRAEFQHADHRQIREYVHEIWGAAATGLWLRALDGGACFSRRDADRIREHRIARRRRKRTASSDSSAIEAGETAIEGRQTAPDTPADGEQRTPAEGGGTQGESAV